MTFGTTHTTQDYVMRTALYIACLLSLGALCMFWLWLGHRYAADKAWVFSTSAIVFGWLATIYWMLVLALAGMIRE